MIGFDTSPSNPFRNCSPHLFKQQTIQEKYTSRLHHGFFENHIPPYYTTIPTAVLFDIPQSYRRYLHCLQVEDHQRRFPQKRSDGVDDDGELYRIGELIRGGFISPKRLKMLQGAVVDEQIVFPGNLSPLRRDLARG
jgi:hypothetical protein